MPQKTHGVRLFVLCALKRKMYLVMQLCAALDLVACSCKDTCLDICFDTKTREYIFKVCISPGFVLF